jgi:hypothetical protein
MPGAVFQLAGLSDQIQLHPAGFTKVHPIQPESLTIWTRCSGGHDREFGDVGLAGGEEGGDPSATFGCGMVAVAVRDFAEQAVGAQQRQMAADVGGAAALFDGDGRSWKEAGAEVAVARAGVTRSCSNRNLRRQSSRNSQPNSARINARESTTLARSAQ